MLIYLAGVMAGSLTVAIAKPHVSLVGASGGVYALIGAHLANVILNWREMNNLGFRLWLILVEVVRTGVAVYYSIYYPVYYSIYYPTKVSHTGHMAGGVVGLLLGLVLLRSLSYKTWEKAIRWLSLLIFLGLFLGAIIWNAIEIFMTEDFLNDINEQYEDISRNNSQRTI